MILSATIMLFDLMGSLAPVEFVEVISITGL